MSQNTKELPLIIVSYYYGTEGSVMSEWAKDKLRVLNSLGKQAYLISGITAGKTTLPNVKQYRLFSLSLNEFKSQISQLKLSGSIRKIHYLLYPLIIVVGGLFDLSVRKLVTRNSDARWSWAFSAFPTSFLLYLRGSRIMFATGGATAGHLLASFFSYLPGTKVYLEFQDPLLGNEIQRLDRIEKAILKLERYFISRSKKTIFVTKRATKEAQARNPDMIEKIECIYPGSWDFKISSKSKLVVREKNEIRIIHLGTLYGSRNLDTLFMALDQIKNDSAVVSPKFKVINIGEIHLSNRETYLSRYDFEQRDPTERSRALTEALDSHVLLLVQHADSRSSQTIPYKTYDYLNLKKPVFGLINNEELKRILMESGGYVADVKEVTEIANKFREISKDFTSGKLGRIGKSFHLDITQQFQAVFL